MCKLVARIQTIALEEGVTIGALERQIGASKGVLSRAINNGTDIQSKWIELVVENYPHISADWLLTGRGDMLRQPPPVSAEHSTLSATPAPITGKGEKLKSVSSTPPPPTTPATPAPMPPAAKHTSDLSKGIPLIPFDAMAGALTCEQTALDYECERYIVPMFKGADFLIPVKGSSMYPKYSSGDVVACQRVPMTDFFQWNKVYVIDTTQGALIKRIKPGSDKEHLLIVSDNESYDPFELPIQAINAVALVIGVIRLE